MKYLGLEISNPIIAASSPLTSRVERVVRLAEAGVGAVVLKSVFEEQIAGQTASLSNAGHYAEAADYLREYLGEDYLRTNLELIRESRKQTNIPIIASINCVSNGKWTEYARRMEDAGAHALQLNIAVLPTSADQTAAAIEQQYLDIVAGVTSAVRMPVQVKLAPRITNVLNLCREIYYRGARGVVIFNRMFEPDIDTDTVTIKAADSLSEHSELRNVLRWVAMVRAEVPKLEIAATTGIHTGDDVVKAILCGASAVEICTALYRDGIEVVERMKTDLAAWMTAHTFESVNQMRGYIKHDTTMERMQYMKYFPTE